MITRETIQEFVDAYNRGELCIEIKVEPDPEPVSLVPDSNLKLSTTRIVIEARKRSLRFGAWAGPQFILDRRLF